MEITQVTTIELDETETAALMTLKEAYEQCAGLDCFECNECPLYVDNKCMGRNAKTILNRPKARYQE